MAAYDNNTAWIRWTEEKEGKVERGEAGVASIMIIIIDIGLEL